MDMIARFQDLKASLPSDTAENVSIREDLLHEARELLLALERPDNVVERVCFQVLETVIISLGIKMGIFRAMKERSSSSIEELAKTTKSDPLLMERVMRTLASFGAVTQTASHDFELNRVSTTFLQPVNEAGMEFCLEFLTPGWLALPRYLEQNGYQNPTRKDNTPMNLAYNKPAGATVWDILNSTTYMPACTTYIASFNAGHKNWMDVYPVEERLVQGFDSSPDAVMMVDIGGRSGCQAFGLKERFPDIQGRLVVQDLPHALPSEDKRLLGIEYMAHDFTKEQPIKGARLYYLRYIPHDWPQDFVVNIMKLLREAMKPGYSKLVVNEWVVPAVGATKFMTAQDINMMVVGGGMERTEALHRDYLERAGLKVNKVYSVRDKISESVIEAEVA